MKLKSTTWCLVGLTLVVFLLLNLVCWQPGIGGARSGPPAAELERYFGWPAQYRAELWHSDDVELLGRMLSRAPFYLPHGEITFQYRYVGWKAVAVNCLFAIFAMVLVGLINEHDESRRWNWKTLTVASFAGLALLLLHWVAPSVYVGL